MENSHSELIKKIAQELDCGSTCYYNPKTGDIIGIPNFLNFPEDDEFQEHFKDELEAVEKNKDVLVKIDVLESVQSFEIMEQFTDQIADKQFQLELKGILNKKKPFQNFKYAIDQSDFRASWFAFKNTQVEKIVENQLNNID
ncbi:UPF0158 family protein [uncultured Formosa sp.]|uniref:UPF0158 family protein n=1 Tax=uncultured Formosa sp. TaxID=255435 RepID=UPI00262A94A8|nr:UPF0158 family protein [uncultured Formosa sp.]